MSLFGKSRSALGDVEDYKSVDEQLPQPTSESLPQPPKGGTGEVFDNGPIQLGENICVLDFNGTIKTTTIKIITPHKTAIICCDKISYISKANNGQYWMTLVCGEQFIINERFYEWYLKNIS